MTFRETKNAYSISNLAGGSERWFRLAGQRLSRTALAHIASSAAGFQPLFGGPAGALAMGIYCSTHQPGALPAEDDEQRPAQPVARVKMLWRATLKPDFSAWVFAAQKGQIFAASDYAEAFHLREADISDTDVARVQAAIDKLPPSAWLVITHETPAA